MKSMKGPKTAALLLAILLFGLAAGPAAAFAPYESYNYNYWEDPVPSPAAYVPDADMTGRMLGVGDLREPSDLVAGPDGRLYVLDSGNNRIIIASADGSPARVLSSFSNDGSEDGFNKPEGLFVAGDGTIYVADTENRRIVMLSPEGELLQIFADPKSDLLTAGFAFYPLKLAVDEAGRVYAVARGVYEGIMQFDGDGSFIGYIGTIRVNPSPGDYFWKLISTQAQRAQMALFVPTEFSNLDIDDKGFVYATNIDLNSDETVKRLSPSGHDVLKRYGYFHVKGDINFFRLSGAGAESGPSKMADVKVREGGMFSVLDSLRGRVFTYDGEGNLLYIFGSKGSQRGTFKAPAAIEEWNGNLLVLDRAAGRISAFRPTAFGSTVNRAASLHAAGEEEQAVEAWREVLRLNGNYDIAYLGIGKALLVEKRNKEAMAYFKLGMDHDYYSVAFKRHRKEVMQDYFSLLLTTGLLAGMGAAAWAIYRRKGRAEA